jgi:hypothetical protein
VKGQLVEIVKTMSSLNIINEKIISENEVLISFDAESRGQNTSVIKIGSEWKLSLRFSNQ